MKMKSKQPKILHDAGHKERLIKPGDYALQMSHAGTRRKWYEIIRVEKVGRQRVAMVKNGRYIEKFWCPIARSMCHGVMELDNGRLAFYVLVN